MPRSDQVELAFALKKEGRTVKEIALEIGVSTRSIFKWFSKNKSEAVDIDVPQSFDDAVAMLSQATANEIAVALSVSQSGRGATDRVYRLGKTLMMIKVLSHADDGAVVEKTSAEMAQLHALVLKRVQDMSKKVG